MTRVCLIGTADVRLPADLLAYETARGALAAYDLDEPYANTVAVETISLGAAVSLLNDLDWYLVRLVDEAIVLEPSVSGSEWLSRDLATAIRNDEVDPAETGDLLEIYGVVEAEADADDDTDESDESGATAAGGVDGVDDAGGIDERDDEPPGRDRPRLAEPMFVQRVGDEVPTYDLREVDDTLVVRVTAEEFGG